MANRNLDWRKYLSPGSCLVYILTIILTSGLKYFYSVTSTEALLWILRPTATIVELITGNPYVFERGTGYINKNIGIIIAKPCAGVNFFIMVFGMSVFTVLHHLRSNRDKVFAFLGCLMGAYWLTIVVNAIRIIGAIKLFQLEGNFLWFDRAAIHRMEGIFFYFLFLSLFYFLLKRIIYKYEYVSQK